MGMTVWGTSAPALSIGVLHRTVDADEPLAAYLDTDALDDTATLPVTGSALVLEDAGNCLALTIDGDLDALEQLGRDILAITAAARARDCSVNGTAGI